MHVRAHASVQYSAWDEQNYRRAIRWRTVVPDKNVQGDSRELNKCAADKTGLMPRPARSVWLLHASSAQAVLLGSPENSLHLEKNLQRCRPLIDRIPCTVCAQLYM